jgi:hypothetical protein
MDIVDEKFPNLSPDDKQRVREALKQSGGGFEILDGGPHKGTKIVNGGHPSHNSQTDPWPAFTFPFSNSD